MAKKKGKGKKSKSLEKSRSRRKLQSNKLEERIKKSQEQSQGKSKSILRKDKDIPTWRPKDGAHIIDVIPYTAGKLDPTVDAGDPTYTYEYWAHVRVGPNDGIYLCPTEMFNKPCPICEHRQKLREADDEAWKGLFPKRRNLYNIICYDRGEENKGVQVWDVSYHYFEKYVLAISRKPSRKGKRERTVNFVDVDNGKSINFTIEPAKSKNDYPDFVGHSFDDRDYKIDDEMLDGAFILDESVHIASYEEIEQAYWGEEGAKKKKKKVTKGSKKKVEIEKDELGELLEELEELEDMDELKEFMRDHEIEIKIKKKDDEDTVKEKIEEALKEASEDEDIDGDDDDDDDDDDDEDVDEDVDDEDDDEDADDEPEYTVKQIRKMKKVQLKKLIKSEELDIDIEDAEDLEELQDMVIEELDLEED